jgi:hypothetical protein
MAVTYLIENHKYARRVRNGNVEVQNLPQDDDQERKMERAEEDEPNGEQNDGRHDQVSPHLHNPG